MRMDTGLKSMSSLSFVDDDPDGSGDEDETEFHVEDCNGLGSKAELRKSNKPIMEKRRRARINNCLNDLKGILLEAMRKDPARHSKLEKADILELTVRHLQNVQRNQLAIAMATDPMVLHRFKNGFSDCATEVSRYLGRLDGVDHGIKQRLTSHLGSCVNGLQQVGPLTFGGHGVPLPVPLGSIPFPHTIPPSPVTPGSISASALLSPVGQDFNNNRKSTIQNLTTPPAPSTVTSSNFELKSSLSFTQRLELSSSAFTPTKRGNESERVKLKRPPTPPLTPPLTLRTNLNQSLIAMSVNEDSFISSTLGNRRPIDFSLTRSGHHSDLDLDLDLGRRSRMETGLELADSSTSPRDSMWRPW